MDFAGVEKFLDTPVKRYSSGMYVRLAFAVAAHLNPEILIVDEVLAVGDAEFQNKCLGKMKDVSSQGRTVLFVSHNMSAIRALCKTGIVLKGGQLARHAPAQAAIAEYLQAASEFSGCSAESAYLKLHEVRLSQDDMENTNTVVFHARRRSTSASKRSSAWIIWPSSSISMTPTTCTSLPCAHPRKGTFRSIWKPGQTVSFRCRMEPVRLLPGRYSLSVFAFRPYDPVTYLGAERVRDFEVAPAVLPGGMWPYGVENRQHGLMRLADAVEMKL